MNELLPRVTIDWLAYAKIMHWVLAAKENEVSGFGKVVRDGGALHVVDAFLLQQRNTPGSTVLDPVDTARAMYQRRDEPGDFNFWWHSHNTMPAFWSGTDYDTIQDLGSNGWLLATVFNARAETKTALFTTQPVPFILENLELKLGALALPAEIKADLDTSYREKVTEVTYQSPAKQHYGNQHWLTKKDRKRMSRLKRLHDARLRSLGIVVVPPEIGNGADEESQEYVDAVMDRYEDAVGTGGWVNE